MTTGSGRVRAGKWSDRLPGAKYWHAELEALEAEMAGGSGRRACSPDASRRPRLVLIQCEPRLRPVTRPIVEAVVQKLGEIPG